MTTTAHRILEMLRAEKGVVISGENFSTRLDISRTAVWKQVQSLKALGYGIESLPSQGYRLVSSPDLLLAAEMEHDLRTSRLGKRVVCLQETDSTNVVAFRLAEEGGEEGTVVAAETQSRGKGRLGRRWESPAGVNLYCSVILRPDILPVAAPRLTFLSAVAVARAIDSCTTLRADIKWPNDILVNGRKVAGLLNEMSAETEKVNFVILGIGVNLNMQPEQFPQDLRQPATSLQIESGTRVSRVGFFHSLIRELDGLYETYLAGGHERIMAEWLSRCNTLGREVSVNLGSSTLCGVVTGVDGGGALLVRLPDGSVEQVLSGDVAIRG